jgi:hypothetical protein
MSKMQEQFSMTGHPVHKKGPVKTGPINILVETSITLVSAQLTPYGVSFSLQ